MANYQFHEFMAVTKALADESRVRVLLALQEGELCVCQIIELLDLAPSTVSKHMAILKQARLVHSRKEGRWIYYRLANEGSSSICRGINWVCTALEGVPQIEKDRKSLREIICMDPEELVQLQKER